jgi:hypothetical protein
MVSLGSFAINWLPAGFLAEALDQQPEKNGITDLEKIRDPAETRPELRDWPVPRSERARVRTEVAAEFFAASTVGHRRMRGN